MADFPAKKGSAYTFEFPVLSSLGEFVTGATFGASELSKDGAGFAPVGAAPVEIGTSGVYTQVLDATEMTCDRYVVKYTVTGQPDVFVSGETVTRQLKDLAYPATSGRSMVVDAAGLVDANAVKVGPTGGGTAQTAGDIMADTNDIQARLPAALVSGRMDASVGAMEAGAITAAVFALDAIDAVAIKADAGTELADALLDRASAIEGYTPRQLLRLFAAVLVGKASGLETATAVYRDVADSKDRVTATVDSDGNRTAVALDAN